MKKFSALILLSSLFLPLDAWSDDQNQAPLTGYFRSSTTPLELLGERGAETLAEVFAPDEELRWQLNVPDTYDPANPPGLIVYVNRGNWGGGKKVWSDVFRDRNLIWAGALDAGDEAPINERMLKAILAPTMLAKTYSIDPRRVYIAGFSGGAHVAAILATSRPELFKGGLFMGGARFWEEKTPPKIDIVRQNRFVFLAGANDVARTRVARTADSYRAAGVMQTKLIIVPNTRQELPGRSYFETAIDYLDGRSNADTSN